MSEQNGKTNLVIGLDNQTKQGFQDIKSDAADMASAVKQSGEQAAQGVNAIGEGAGAAAQKFSRAESSIAASLKRHIEQTKLATQAGDSLAKAYEQKIELRGLDASKLSPFIQQLRDAEDALSHLKAKEREVSAQNIFAEKHRQAQQLVKSSEYVRFWTQSLDQAEAAERKAAGQNAFVQSLREQSAAIGKTRADLLELKAAQLGVGNEAAPYISKLRESEKAIDGVGTSSKQTAWAMRMLPAQMNDVIVSLQGGQRPMTVFLQQGTQVRDMFGGWGIAARSVGAYLVGMLNPLTLSAAAVAALGFAYYQGSKEVDGYRKALILSGNQAGTSTDQLTKMAREIASVSGTQSVAAAALAQMTQTSKVGSDSLREYTTVAIQWEKATGESVGKVAGKFADLAKDPLQASLKLNEEMNHLTASVYDQIKALEKQGKTTEAAAVAQRAYADTLNSRQAEIVANIGYVERAWLGVTSGAKKAWDAMLGIGRADTPMSQSQKHLDSLQQQLSLKLQAGPVNEQSRASYDKGVELIKKQIESAKAFLGAMQSVDSLTAGMATNNKDYVDSMEDYDKVAGQFASKETKRKAALTVEQNKYTAAVEATKKAWAGSSELDKKLADLQDKHQKSVSGINKQFEEKGGGNSGASAIAGIHARIQAEEELIKRLEQHGKNAQKVSEADQIVAKLQYEVDKATDARTKTLKQQQLAEAKHFQDRQNYRLELERGIKSQDDAEAAYRKYIDTITRSAIAVGEQANKQEAANTTFGKSKVAIEQMVLAQKQAALLNAKDAGLWTQEHLDALKMAADEQERYVKALMQATYLATEHKYDEGLKVAQEQLQLQQYGMSLLGVEEVKRAKLIAVKQSELKLQKEIRDIEKESYSLDPVENEKRKNKLIADARAKSEVELQAELGKIQEQHVMQQVEKYDQIWRQGFADMVNSGMDGLKAFGKSLKTTVLTSIADGIYQALLRKYVVNITANIMGGIEGIAGMVGQLLGVGGGSAGGGGLMSLLSSGSSVYSLLSGNSFVSTLGSFFSGSGGSGFLGMFGSMFGAGAGTTSAAAGAAAGMIPSTGAIGAGGAAAGGMSGVNPIIPLAVIAGMFMSNKLFSAGISVDSWSKPQKFTDPGNWFQTNSLKPILGGRIANVLTGAPVAQYIFDSLFGRKLKDGGIEGEFGGASGFEGKRYEYYKGGLFRSNKTKYNELEEETRKAFSDQFGVIKDGVKYMAESIGLSAEKIDTYSEKIKLSLMGLTDAEVNKKIDEMFKGVADGMAAAVLETDKYKKGEETKIETLARLSSRMVNVNRWLDVTGDKLLEVSVVGADMASSLVDAFGGDSGFSSAVQSFVGKYFSRAEQLGLANKQVGDVLKGVGIDTIPKTREELRALMNAQDLTTESGRKAYAALMGVADILDTVYSAAEELAAMNLDMDIELLRAQGKETEAIALEREKRIKELMPFGDEIVNKQRQIWAEQDKRLADEQRRAMEEELAANVRKAKEDAQNKAMRNLEEATRREVDALNMRKSALSEQRALASESLGLITGVFDLVRENARALYGEVQSVAEMQASQGRVFIEQALGTALRTGYLPDKDQLSQAIAAARSGIEEGAYKSQAEKEYDTLLLAGKLTALELITGKQKTAQEQQLEMLDQQITSIDKQTKALQDQLAHIKDLISIAKGEYDATISVEQAIRDVYRLWDLKTSPPKANDGKGSGRDPLGDVIGPGDTGAPSVRNVQGERTKNGDYYMEVITPMGSFIGESSGEKTERLKAADKWLDKYRGTGDVAGMLNDAKASGYTMHDLSTVMGWSWRDLVDAGKRLGIPQFAVGTNYIKRDMVAMVHEGERIMPKADNHAIIAALESGGANSNSADVVTAIRKLEALLVEIDNNTAKGAEHARRTADDISQVTEGGNAMRVFDMA